jgi:hypothetical protein
MTLRPPAAVLLAPLALALLAACASSAPRGLLRVDLSGAGAGPGAADEQQLLRAVRDAAGAEGLVCQPGPGGSLLRCSPGAVGPGHAITVDLDRAGTGYAVTIRQALALPGRRSPVCDVQRRLADRIDGELALSAARVDRRSDCHGK